MATQPKRIPDFSWNDESGDRATFTNGLSPLEFEAEHGIGFVQIQALADDPLVYLDLPAAKCLRRWLDDAIAAAEEAIDVDS